ncbi:MAG: hypothetical protein ABF824_15760, partial [Acetobacter sp.]
MWLNPTVAHAQAIDLSHGGQITVTAVGGFDWDQNAQKVTAYDQAQAVRGDVTVTADKLIAFYRKKAAAPTAPGAQPAPGQPQTVATPPTATAPAGAPPSAPPPAPAPPTTTEQKPAAAPSPGGSEESGANEI